MHSANKVARSLTVAVALAACSIATASPAHQAAASGGASPVNVQQYDCLQGDSIPTPAGLAPDAPAPPDLLNKLLAEPLHKNGQMCATFTGGTPAQQQSAIVAFRASQPQQQAAMSPLNSQCSGTDAKYTPLLENVNGDNISVVTHWRLNADCTHTFYNNQYSFNSSPNQLWLQGSSVCDASNAHCTNFVGAGLGCWNIPYTIQFNSVGLGDQDSRFWQSNDQYDTTNPGGGCYGLTSTNAAFAVDTSG